MKLMNFDDAVMSRIDECVKYTEAHIYTESDLLSMLAFGSLTDATRPHYVEIPDGYEVLYLIQRRPDGGTHRHLSVRNINPGHYATPGMCETLIEFYGFKNPLDSCFKELITGKDNFMTVHIIEEIN